MPGNIAENRKKHPPRKIYGPYSRVLRESPLYRTIDGRSATGRLIRDLEEQLYQHVGGRERSSVTQRLLIDRLIRIKLRIDAFDRRLDAGEWTDLDGRTYGGLQNAYRLCIRELGIKPAKIEKPVDALGYAAQRANGKAA
jgi:hypothetical protein